MHHVAGADVTPCRWLNPMECMGCGSDESQIVAASSYTWRFRLRLALVPQAVCDKRLKRRRGSVESGFAVFAERRECEKVSQFVNGNGERVLDGRVTSDNATEPRSAPQATLAKLVSERKAEYGRCYTGKVGSQDVRRIEHVSRAVKLGECRGQ
jgi:hypothetical protein